MKITFVYLDIDPYFPAYGGRFNFGIAALSAVLKQHGHTTSLIHITHPVSEGAFEQALKKEKPDLLGFSSTTNMFHFVKKYASHTKKIYDVPIICGGAHATAAPDETIQHDAIDIVCIGEGELPLVKLCESLQRGDDISLIGSLWVRKNGKIHRNPTLPLIENLDDLPFPDLEIFDYEKLQDTKDQIGVVSASRGCPFQCSYCINRTMRQLYSNQVRYVRFKGIPRIISEIKQLLKFHPKTKYLVFYDDTFILNRRWFCDFAEIYTREIGLPYMCTGHIEVIDEERAGRLKSSGCARLWIGVESGNDFIRQKILKRPVSAEKIINAFNILRTHRITTHVFNMVGIPYENKARILDTIKLNSRIKPQGMQVTVFYPYPGTELYEVCLREGFLLDRHLLSYRFDSILKLPDLTPSQIRFFQRYFIILTRLYSFFEKLPPQNYNKMELFLERVICSRFFPYGAAVLVYDISYTTLRLLYAYVVRHFYSRKKRQFQT
ncbi:MAG: radical SAM protein [bacterium]